ncbi:glycosyltransferase [Cyanobacterium stanieri LEGE 03274]|uniref:Glycosyltransferase n=1 Tax=Cyanobacterium stanieri LEGE 03274 TaxID=1828756 RepID=A0ABR9V1V6_9CHRO|nr:glycosyltransferase [Cyanobacterium stanieri]MBE9221868.1 glycosyltransferase [Cyanobacterium stanieri LEGE 03274]
MKLLFYVPYNRIGGVERVIISLVNELSQQVEQLILVASPSLLSYYQSQIIDSDKIVYQPFTLVNSSYKNKLLGLINKINIFANKINLDIFKNFKQSYYQNLVFEQIINKYNITHCLYAIANRINPPKVKVPLFMISYDIFWHFSPLTYSKEYTNEYDSSLLQWLQKSNGVITISQQTKQDITTLFPQYQSQIKCIPIAGFFCSDNLSNTTNTENKKEIIFLFPSSFGIYKDHLTVIKAGIILAKEKNYNFKVVFIGKETDKILSSKINLSQQNSTKEYQTYIKELEYICQENEQIIDQHFTGLGYCSDEELEHWYQKSNCVIFPSRYEGFGLAISEAIVRGIPVIASDLTVFKEQVDLYQCPERVILFPCHDSQELSREIEHFIQNPIEPLNETDIEHYRNTWNWGKVAQTYIEYLKQW